MPKCCPGHNYTKKKIICCSSEIQTGHPTFLFAESGHPYYWQKVVSYWDSPFEALIFKPWGRFRGTSQDLVKTATFANFKSF